MLRWTEIGRELNRRDDDCRRQWKKNAPHEDLMKYKTIRVKSASCIKSKRTTNRKDSVMNDPTVQPLVCHFFIDKNKLINFNVHVGY